MSDSHNILQELRAGEEGLSTSTELDVYFARADKYLEILVEGLQHLSTVEVPREKIMLRAALLALLSSVVQQVEAMRIILKRGLQPPFSVLNRSAFEAILLASYLSLNPEKAGEWLNGKHISMATVRKGLPYTDQLADIYGMLSETSHPNSASVRLMLFKEPSQSLAIALSGVFFPEKMHAAANSYVALALYVANEFIDICKSLGDESNWTDLQERISSINREQVPMFQKRDYPQVTSDDGKKQNSAESVR